MGIDLGSLLKHKRKYETRPVLSIDNRAQIKIRYLMELENMEAALKFDDRKTASVRFFSVIKDFFCEILGANHSMTFEEIIEKLHRSHIDRGEKGRLDKFLKNLSAEEYGQQKITKIGIRKGLREFRELIQGL